MAIGVILGVVFGIFMVAGFIIGGISLYQSYCYNSEIEDERNKYSTDENKISKYQSLASSSRVRGVTFMVVAILSVILFTVAPFSFYTVDTGTVTVVKELGKIKESKDPGTYCNLWMTHSKSSLDTKAQQLEIVTSVYSSDGQTLTVSASVQYSIQTDHACDIVREYGNLSVLQNRINAVSTERIKSVFSTETAMNIIRTRNELSAQVTKYITDAISEGYYVNVSTVVLTNIDFTDEFERIIEQKVAAEQEAEKAKNEAERKKTEAEAAKAVAILEAEASLEVAKREADAKLALAQSEAQAKIEVARAEARAIQMKSIEVARTLGFNIVENIVTDDEGSESIEYTIDFEGKSAEEVALITDYLKYAEYLSKWDGELPGVVAGDSATVVIPTP